MSQLPANPFGTPATIPSTGASVGAVSQREVAEVQAMLVVAKSAPRDAARAFESIKAACGRPQLAAVAMYQYTRGGTDVMGPSIRLAEEMARHWGNLQSNVVELDRRHGMSECMAYCWDLESNYRDEKRFFVPHVREKQSGNVPLRSDRDIYELIMNNGQRRKRACILSVIPSDIQEMAVNECAQTLKANIQITDELISELLGAFEPLGVTRQMIETKIQRHMTVDAMQPGHVIMLRNVYRSVRDGMGAVSDFFTVEEAAPAPRTAADKMDQIVADNQGPDESAIEEATPESTEAISAEPEPPADEPAPEPEPTEEPVSDEADTEEPASLFGEDD